MNITTEERQILAHGIIESDDWIAKTNGSEFEGEITKQLERLRPLWEVEKDKAGYKTAAQKVVVRPVQTPEPTIMEILEQLHTTLELQTAKDKAMAKK